MAEQDRRIRRTRRLLTEALISLILEQGYQRTTVQDILERADIGRSTFYAHFRDKDDLLLSGFTALREELRQQLAASPSGTESADPTAPAAAVFAYAHRHQRVFRALCGRQGGQLVTRHLHRMLVDLVREQLPPELPDAGGPVPVDVVAEYYASGTLGLLGWWVDQGFPHDPGRLARMHRAVALPGLLAGAAPVA
jgi:AcrR family transcriptional regulator